MRLNGKFVNGVNNYETINVLLHGACLEKIAIHVKEVPFWCKLKLCQP
jgi:hypothetical protein